MVNICVFDFVFLKLYYNISMRSFNSMIIKKTRKLDNHILNIRQVLWWIYILKTIQYLLLTKVDQPLYFPQLYSTNWALEASASNLWYFFAQPLGMDIFIFLISYILYFIISMSICKLKLQKKLFYTLLLYFINLHFRK